MMNKTKTMIALLATVVTVAANAETSNNQLVKISGESQKFTSNISLGYQNYNIDRGVYTLGESGYAGIGIRTPFFAGLDALANINYATTGGSSDVFNLSTGVGSNVKVGDFGQYVSLTMTKRVNSPLEAYEANLSFQFTELPVPYVNKLFTPVLTLAKTWDGNNKGLIAGVTRSDTFSIAGREFTLDNTVAYGTFDNYEYVQLNGQISTKLIGRADLVAGVNYINDLDSGAHNKHVPYYVGININF